MRARKRAILEISGLCTTGYHSKCPGALPRPKTRPIAGGAIEPTPASEHWWFCKCECHDGQTIELKEDTTRTDGSNARALKKRVRASTAAGLKANGFIDVPLPDNPEDEAEARRELRAAGRMAGVKLHVTAKGGRLRATMREAKNTEV